MNPLKIKESPRRIHAERAQRDDIPQWTILIPSIATISQAELWRSICIWYNEQTRTVNAGRPSEGLQWICQSPDQRWSAPSTIWWEADIFGWSNATAKTVRKAPCSLPSPILKNTDVPRDKCLYHVDYGWVHSGRSRWTIQKKDSWKIAEKKNLIVIFCFKICFKNAV